MRGGPTKNLVGPVRNDEATMTAEEIANLLKEALDGIELLDNEEREDLIRWAAGQCSLGMWGLAGREVLIGIHNKCVLDCRVADPTWRKAQLIAQ